MGKDVWVGALLTGLIVFIALLIIPLPKGIAGYAVAGLIGGAGAFVSWLVAKRAFNA
jgi:hypothetical protein